MKKELVETMAGFYGERVKDEFQKVREFIKDDLLEHGTRVYLAGEELYYKKIEFDTDGGTNTREWIESEGKEVDVSKMSEDELWKYIYGEYILRSELGKIDGFGVTQVQTY